MFIAHHAVVEHAMTLPLSADEAFPLFTPEGERHWISEWNPRYFYPSNGETLVGMVFTTGQDQEFTHWTLVDFDLNTNTIRYSRVTSGSRSGLVAVQCDPVTDRECRVVVRYVLTGLSEAGNATITIFVDGFAAMIDDWRDKIISYLDRSNVKILP
jgi:hypothetical protein